LQFQREGSQSWFSYFPVQNQETGFKIFRRIASGSWDYTLNGYSEIGTAQQNTTSWTDNTVLSPGTYSYVVVAYNGAGNSLPKAESRITIVPPPLSVSISGPDWVTGKHYYTYTANVSNGSGNITYQWYKDGQALGTASQQSVYSGMTSFTVQCNVHDNGTGQDASGSLYVVNEEEGGVKSPFGADAQAIPTEYSISSNYPNPFNPETEIRFGLPENSNIKIVVLDLLGREVKRVVSERSTAGYHIARWDGKDNAGAQVASGIYFAKIIALGESGKQFSQVIKMLMAK
jgi:hypothetical protein